MRKLILTIFISLIFSINFANGEDDKFSLNVKNPITNLQGLGINSVAIWSGASFVSPNDPKFLDHYKNLSNYGFKYVVLVSCADWIIDLYCTRAFQNKDNIIKGAKLILDNTNLHVIVQLKAQSQKKIDGAHISELNTQLEKSEEVAKKFKQTWIDISKELKQYPKDRLSFNLLNEPEFQQPKPTKKKRDKWLSIAKDTSIAIREVSPDRVIIIEGINKSLFAARKNGSYRFEMETLLAPIDMDNIIYAFHNYEPFEFLQQGKFVKKTGGEYKKKYTNMVEKDAQRIIKWANKHNVPVMLTETGCVGYFNNDSEREGPKTNEDCGKYAADVKKFYIDNGIGVAWWSLEGEKTIYNRDCGGNCFRPRNLIPNKALFEGFGLTYR
jgi:endoglucanase